jgi:hypothetical protein
LNSLIRIFPLKEYNCFMNEKTTFLAAINTFYSTGNDFIGIFSEILLNTLDEDSRYSVSQLQERVTTLAGVDIPLDVIKTILKRLKREDKISYSDMKNIGIESIKITSKGVSRKSENTVHLKKLKEKIKS